MNKVTKKSKRIESFAVVNENAAGIDIASGEHAVAVCPHVCHENVRTFGSFTCDLMDIVDWLTQCEVRTIAMESTGVYWIALFLLLQEHGFEVILVNASHVKNVTGKKDDETDAAWIQKLHTCGLLRPCFQPDEHIRSLRTVVRHRESLIQDGSRFLNRMQKALEQMNIKIHLVISDLAGKTGRDIIEAILEGQRDAEVLADLADPRIQASREDMVKSLEGYWREEHLFTLRQCYDMYEIINDQIRACDEQIEALLAKAIAKENEGEIPDIDLNMKRKRSTGKNKLSFNATPYLKALLGVDATKVDGFNEVTVLKVVSEVGTDMSKWNTDKHYTSWLNICPNTKKSGGKVISSKLNRRKNRAAQAFRTAANTLSKSKSPPGHFYRRIRSRSGAGVATVATGRKLAVVFYHMVKYKQEYNPDLLMRSQKMDNERKINRLQKRIDELKAAAVA